MTSSLVWGLSCLPPWTFHKYLLHNPVKEKNEGSVHTSVMVSNGSQDGMTDPKGPETISGVHQNSFQASVSSIERVVLTEATQLLTVPSTKARNPENRNPGRFDLPLT